MRFLHSPLHLGQVLAAGQALWVRVTCVNRPTSALYTEATSHQRTIRPPHAHLHIVNFQRCKPACACPTRQADSRGGHTLSHACVLYERLCLVCITAAGGLEPWSHNTSNKTQQPSTHTVYRAQRSTGSSLQAQESRSKGKSSDTQPILQVGYLG